jgi:hypothetical protein
VSRDCSRARGQIDDLSAILKGSCVTKGGEEKRGVAIQRDMRYRGNQSRYQAIASSIHTHSVTASNDIVQRGTSMHLDSHPAVSTRPMAISAAFDAYGSALT